MQISAELIYHEAGEDAQHYDRLCENSFDPQCPCEISDGFEIRSEFAQQPDEFEVAMRLALKQAGGTSAIEIAIDGFAQKLTKSSAVNNATKTVTSRPKAVNALIPLVRTRSSSENLYRRDRVNQARLPP